MQISLKSITLVFLSLGLLTFGGCGEAADEATNSVTCHDVCERYRSCFDPDYDVDGCEDRCENDATADEDKEAKLEACDSCLDGQSCLGAAISCPSCAGIVP